MCGILALVRSEGNVEEVDESVLDLLERRGPDCFNSFSVASSGPVLDDPNTHSITFAASVLALRGGRIQAQPLVDNERRCVLCWNGDAWKHDGLPVTGNDTAAIFELLLTVSKTSAENFVPDLVNLIANINGPFSFVFYDAFHSKLFYARDKLGRRSLLQSRSKCGNVFVSSVGLDILPSRSDEVDASGIHVLDFNAAVTSPALIPWPNPLPTINRSIPITQIPLLTTDSQCVTDLEKCLRNSLNLRVTHLTDLTKGPPTLGTISDSRLAVLFSGGLDCTILARLSHDLLPLSTPINLLNVAFENPRSISASTTPDRSPYETCPDRITGRATHTELQRVCPDRSWRFVAIDIPFTESESHRSTIIQLMAPHNTEMDLSIAKALYFAARGVGMITDPSSGSQQPYSTPARVLLSGLGADELFGGYTRHRSAFERRGFEGLIEELDLDTRRLGQRNLGRDDRIISHWGRQVRYPYLDEDFLGWVVQLPVWDKCGFGETASEEARLEPEGLDPAKKALRLLAWKLGMRDVAREKKRAIQFGARTAKMDVNRVGKGGTRGTDVVR